MPSKHVDKLIASGAQPPVKGSDEWKALIDIMSEECGYKICGRKRTSNGWPCMGRPKTNGCCKMHGGDSPPPGPSHPAFKHGRYSKVLEGSSLAELYEQARNDPKLLSLEEDIAILVARQKQTLGQLLSTGESKNAWKRLHDLVRGLTSQVGLHRDVLDDEHAMHRAEQRIDTILEEVRQLIDATTKDFALWDEYDKTTGSIRRLVDTERKYREGQGINLQPERANLMMLMISEALRRSVPAQYLEPFERELYALRQGSTPNQIGRAIEVPAHVVENVE